MAENNSEKNKPPRVLTSLPHPQKIAVSLLALLAILIVFFWAWQFKANINRPFKIASIDDVATNTYVDPREQDTDNDGLSDYDELNVYKTSPYLEDTDSDGILDKKEADQGTDPNCPLGRNCNVTAEGESNTATSAAIMVPDLTPPSNLNASGTPEVILQTALAGQLDATSLRKLLLDSGIDQATLDQISDADLLSIYQESLTNQNIQTQ